jgi:hypothetical protein
MSRIWCRRLLAVFAVGVTTALAGPLAAVEGGGEDPAGDTDPAGGAIDIVAFTHDNTEEGDILYTLTTAEAWTAGDDLTEIVWQLDFSPEDDTENDDACVEITPGDPDGIAAALFSPCDAADPEDATVTGTHTDGEDLLEVEYPQSALDDLAGEELASYSYRISAVDAGDPAAADSAPDDGEEQATHVLAQAASPTPTGTPSAEPTVAPTAEPTVAQTPSALPLSVGRPELPRTGGNDMRTLASGVLLFGSTVVVSVLRRRRRLIVDSKVPTERVR